MDSIEKKLPAEEAKLLKKDFDACYEDRPWLAMVNSDKGVTNLHVPSDVIIDASMPNVIRDSGQMWNNLDELEDTKCLIPDRCYATMHQEIISFVKTKGQFDVSTMGNVANYDIIIIGLQEIVDLNIRNIVLYDNNALTQHEYWINSTLEVLNNNNNNNKKYKCTTSKHLVGLLSCIFIKIDDDEKIKNIEHNIKYIGCHGMAGNKGSISLRLQYYDKSFCFTNVHLPSGSDNVCARNRSLQHIIDTAYFNINDDSIDDDDSSSDDDDNNKNKIACMNDHDYTFLFGDLNYRVADHDNDNTHDNSFKSIINMIETLSKKQKQEQKEKTQEQQLIEKLLKYDQYTIETNNDIMQNNKKNVFSKYYKEGHITFLPTYRFVFNNTDNMYNVDNEHYPSWCDRILYNETTKEENNDNTNATIKQLVYASCTMPIISDHKPVKSIFTIKDVKCNIDSKCFNNNAIDEDEYRSIKKEIIRSLYNNIVTASTTTTSLSIDDNDDNYIVNFVKENYPKNIKQIKTRDHGNSIAIMLLSNSVMKEVIVFTMCLVVFIIFRLLFFVI